MTENGNDISGRGWKSAIKGLVMLAVLGLAVYLVRRTGLSDLLEDAAWFQESVLGSGPLSVFFYVGVAAISTALGLPRQLVAFLGGLAFGVIGGTLLATLGAGLGCAIASSYARWGGRDFLARHFGARVKKVDAFLRHEPFKTALAIRLFPFGSNFLVNLAAGISSIPLLPFLLGSTLGYIPQNLIFALFGAGMNKESRLGVALSVGTAVLLFVISAWIGIVVLRRYRARTAEAAQDA